MLKLSFISPKMKLNLSLILTEKYCLCYMSPSDPLKLIYIILFTVLVCLILLLFYITYLFIHVLLLWNTFVSNVFFALLYLKVSYKLICPSYTLMSFYRLLFCFDYLLFCSVYCFYCCLCKAYWTALIAKCAI